MTTPTPKQSDPAAWPFAPAAVPLAPPYETSVELDGETDAYRVEPEDAVNGRWPWPTSDRRGR